MPVIRKADELLRTAAVPEALPEGLRRALPRQEHMGLFEVVERDGV